MKKETIKRIIEDWFDEWEENIKFKATSKENLLRRLNLEVGTHTN